VAINNFDLVVALPLIEIWYCGEERGSSLFCIECLAGHPEALLIVFESGFEIGHEQISKLAAGPKEVSQMGAPLKVTNRL
jgi:hypothetical protein